MHCPSLGWWRVPLVPADGDRGVDWELALELPWDAEPGDYLVMVVVRDEAGNRLERWGVFTVVEEQ